MTATYTVNSWDVCCSGNERLRNRDEFMITVPVSGSTDLDDVRREMKADIQGYMQPEWFDYSACRAAIDTFCDDTLRPLMEAFNRNPFADLETESEDGGDGCYLYVYMQAPCEVPVY